MVLVLTAVDTFSTTYQQPNDYMESTMAYDLGKAPLNLRLMSGDRKKLANLRPVTSTQLHSNSSTELDPEGLFSQDIFGRVGDPRRMKIMSYIDLHTKIMHPLIWKNIERVSGWYTEIFLGRRYATFDEKSGQFLPSNVDEGKTGPNFFLKHLKNVKFERNKSKQRDLRIDVIEKYRESAIYDFVLVLPAGHRDIEEGRGGNIKFDEINDVYRALIGLSKNIDKSDLDNQFNHRSQALMQKNFNAIFELIFTFLKGKGGFTAAKWTKRKVEHGTRTVFSSMRLQSRDIKGPQRITINDIHVGISQTMRGCLPLVTHKLTTRFANVVFNSDGTANLIDKKTLKRKVVPVDNKWRDLYTTEDGVLSLIKEFKVDSYKFKDVEVQGYPAALIYRDADSFMVKTDIDDFPEKLRGQVRPITKFELYYYLISDIDQETACWGTRYPFATEDSMFPALPYLKTTIVGEALYELDNFGNKTEKVYREFPILNTASLDTASVHPIRLKGLGADFDGDTLSIEFVMTMEAVEEVKKYLNDPVNLIGRGKFLALFTCDVTNWMLDAYTSPKPVEV